MLGCDVTLNAIKKDKIYSKVVNEREMNRGQISIIYK